MQKIKWKNCFSDKQSNGSKSQTSKYEEEKMEEEEDPLNCSTSIGIFIFRSNT